MIGKRLKTSARNCFYSIHRTMLMHIQQGGMDGYHATGHICSSNVTPAVRITPSHHTSICLQDREGETIAVQRRHTTRQLAGHSSGITTISGVTPSKNAAVRFQSGKGVPRHFYAWQKRGRLTKIQVADAVTLGAMAAVIPTGFPYWMFKPSIEPHGKSPPAAITN